MTDVEFLKKVIDEELRIIGSDLTWDYIQTHPEETREWFRTNSFKTVEQFNQWRRFCYEQIHRLSPRMSRWKRRLKFAFLNLQFGLKCDFEELPKYDKTKIQYKKDLQDPPECKSLYTFPFPISEE